MKLDKINPKQFVKVPYTLLDKKTFEWFDNIQPDTTRLVYIAMQYFRDNGDNKIRMSQEKIGEVINMSEKQVLRHIQRLSEVNIIEIKADPFDFYGWNTYKFLIDEEYYAEIPYEIAFNKKLTATQLIAYCNLKRMIDLDKKDFVCYADTERLIEAFNCSAKHIHKIKNALKEKDLIDFKPYNSKIDLVYEQKINHIIKTDNRKKHIERTVKSKNNKGAKKHATSDII